MIVGTINSSNLLDEKIRKIVVDNWGETFYNTCIEWNGGLIGFLDLLVRFGKI